MDRHWFKGLLNLHKIIQQMFAFGPWPTIKRALWCFKEEIWMQDFNIYNINEIRIQTEKYFVFHNWINKLSSEENKVPEHCLKLGRWQGPPHINKVTDIKLVVTEEDRQDRNFTGMQSHWVAFAKVQNVSPNTLKHQWGALVVIHSGDPF